MIDEDVNGMLAPLSWPLERGVVFSDLALLTTMCAVVGLFLVAPETLESRGIAYLTSGGGLFSKVHPSTLLALAALGLRCLAARRPLHAAWRLATGDAGAVLMLGAFVITAFYAVSISYTPVTPLIDTFLLPVLMLLLLRGLDPTLLRILATLVAVVFCANAVIALIEFSRHWHLITIPVPEGATSDPTRPDATFDWRAQLAHEWRATALFGHPLTNGLITGALIICAAARGTRWVPIVIKMPVVLLQCVAMFAFGARSALVLTIVATLLLLGEGALGAIRAGRRVSPRQVAIVLVGLGIVAAVGAAFVDSGFLDKTLERFQNDAGSATTRLTMFDLFSPFSWADVMLGPDPLVVSTQQRLQGLEFGIESSWVGLLLIYGGVVTAILVTGLAAFSRSVMKAAGHGSGVVLVYFFALASGAATLNTKTTIFAMTIVLILIFLQKDVDRQPARPATQRRSNLSWP